MTLITSGAIAKQLNVDRDKVSYALRKLAVRPVGRAGHVRVFPYNTPQRVKNFLNKKGKKKKKNLTDEVEYPEGYKEDLTNAVSAVSRGADAYKVYRRIAATYPGQSAELKSILLYTPTTKRLDAIREALFGKVKLKKE